MSSNEIVTKIINILDDVDRYSFFKILITALLLNVYDNKEIENQKTQNFCLNIFNQLFDKNPEFLNLTTKMDGKEKIIMLEILQSYANSKAKNDKEIIHFMRKCLNYSYNNHANSLKNKNAVDEFITKNELNTTLPLSTQSESPWHFKCAIVITAATSMIASLLTHWNYTKLLHIPALLIAKTAHDRLLLNKYTVRSDNTLNHGNYDAGRTAVIYTTALIGTES